VSFCPLSFQTTINLVAKAIAQLQFMVIILIKITQSISFGDEVKAKSGLQVSRLLDANCVNLDRRRCGWVEEVLARSGTVAA